MRIPLVFIHPSYDSMSLKLFWRWCQNELSDKKDTSKTEKLLHSVSLKQHHITFIFMAPNINVVISSIWMCIYILSITRLCNIRISLKLVFKVKGKRITLCYFKIIMKKKAFKYKYVRGLQSQHSQVVHSNLWQHSSLIWKYMVNVYNAHEPWPLFV